MGKHNDPVPVPVAQVKITITNNGAISVIGFPSSLSSSLELLHRAEEAVVEKFITEAKKGNLTDDNVVKESPLVVPKHLS